jgi:hypothetical protein
MADVDYKEWEEIHKILSEAFPGNEEAIDLGLTLAFAVDYSEKLRAERGDDGGEGEDDL